MAGLGHDNPLGSRLIALLRLLLWTSFAVIVLGWVGYRNGLLPDPGAALIGAVAGVVRAGAPAGPAGEAVGQRVAASDLELGLFDGGTTRLADLRGRVVVLNFWASWCPPCRAEAPTFARVAEAYRARGVAFVGVNIQDNDADARAFLREFDITYPNGPDRTGQIAADYGVAGIPTTVIIDPVGRIARRWVGGLTEQRLVAFIEEARS